MSRLGLPGELKSPTISAGKVGLEALISPFAREKYADKLREYHAIRDGLSGVCEWDAPPDKYDQRHYDISCQRVIPYALRL